VIAFHDCHFAYRAHPADAGVPVFDGIDLQVHDREIVSVLGPSGCGKTTLLRMIAGLVRPDRGEVTIDGRVVTGPGRDCGFVFQDHALLPWADILSNVAFGLELRGVGRAAREERARDLVQTVGLAGFERAYPRQLSGGMQQRVGLARALALDPSTLLMDEPFGSLDSQTRRSLQDDLARLHAAAPKTIVFVTHSVDEAVRLGDRVVLLGRRPARVEASFDVPLPRPRPEGLDSVPAFVEMKRDLWARLRAQAEAAS
jgi:ABC-type nitrate/sulfonate/bicarbonate transport system ATPase subunit